MVTVADLMERLRDVPGATPVLLSVTERDEEDRRVTTFYYAEWAKIGEDVFHIRGYGKKELERQAEAAR